MKKLSPAQKRALETLKWHKDWKEEYQWGAKGPTVAALLRLGLVEWRKSKVKIKIGADDYFETDCIEYRATASGGLLTILEKR